MSQPLLGEYVDPNQEMASLRRKIQNLEDTVADLREQLQVSQQQGKASVRVLQSLRHQLGGLYGALKMVFGELDSVDTNSEQVEAGTSSRASAAWDRWIQQLGGNRSSVLKALLEHGEMTRVQLRVASQVPDGSLNGVTSELFKMGLINRGGGKYSLKQL